MFFLKSKLSWITLNFHKRWNWTRDVWKNYLDI